MPAERVSGDRSSGDAGERVFERLFRMPGTSSPSERKVSDAAFSRAMNGWLGDVSGYAWYFQCKCAAVGSAVHRGVTAWNGNKDTPS